MASTTTRAISRIDTDRVENIIAIQKSHEKIVLRENVIMEIETDTQNRTL